MKYHFVCTQGSWSSILFAHKSYGVPFCLHTRLVTQADSWLVTFVICICVSHSLGHGSKRGEARHIFSDWPHGRRYMYIGYTTLLTISLCQVFVTLWKIGGKLHYLWQQCALIWTCWSKKTVHRLQLGWDTSCSSAESQVILYFLKSFESTPSDIVCAL